ncbi:MAG: hypothetical protein ACI8WB_001622 [Phenylobacterium sp.]|jgi:hypothetical protein
MEIGSAFSSGLQGFQQASGQLTEETININRQAAQQQSLAEGQQPGAEPQAVQPQAQSLESSIVGLTTASNNAQASARAIETADEVLGSIIDVRV